MADEENIQEIAIDTDTIQLDQFLKWAGVLASGGELKPLIEERRVRRNGEIETARRRKLVPGDVIHIDGMGSWKVIRQAD